MTRTRKNWTRIACLRHSDAPREEIVVEVREDGAALPKGTRLLIDRPCHGQIRTFACVDGQTVCLDLDVIEEVV